MATRKTRLVIAFVLMLSLVSFFSIPASVFAEDPIVDASTPTPTYTVSYNHGGPATVHYAAGTVVTVGALATGYTGWKLNGNDTDLGKPLNTTYMPGDTFVMPANAVNFKAFKGENAHSVYYNGNGSDSGILPVDLNNPYLEDKSVIVLGPGDLARIGYVFVEWNTKSDGTGSNYDPGDQYKMHDHDVTFYAQWERVSGLVFSKEVDPTTVKSKSTTVNYTFTVTNTGIFNLKDIRLSDNKLDINKLLASNLATGASFTTSVPFTLTPSLDWHSNAFTNIAEVTADYDDPELANFIEEQGHRPDIRVTDSAIVTYIPPTPGLTFTKEVDRSIVYTTGAAVNYTFTVTNTGDFDLYNINLSDPLLPFGNFAIPNLSVGAIAYTKTFGPYTIGNLATLNWSGDNFTNIASVSASYGAVQSIQTVEIDCITPVEDPQRGSIGPITDSAIVTYMPGTLTIYKDVPEVTEDGTPFTFVVTEVVNDRETSISLNNVHIPYTTTVAVSENSPLTLYELPDGEYQVEELTPPDYYTISGSAIQNVYIGYVWSNDQRIGSYEQSVTFTNNYYVPPTTTTTTTTRRSTTTIVPEPIPAGPVVTPEVVLDEPVPAAPLPKTGGLDPGFLYGLGALLATGGLVIRKRKDK